MFMKDYACFLFLKGYFNTLNAKLNPICHLLALLGAHNILHVSRVKVNPEDEVGPSISFSVVLCSFALLVDIVVIVLVVCLCPSSVHVVATFGLYCSAGLVVCLCASSVNVVATFGLYCSDCFGSLFVSILCICCSQFWFIL